MHETTSGPTPGFCSCCGTPWPCYAAGRATLLLRLLAERRPEQIEETPDGVIVWLDEP
jgi:hypothetical protein